MVFPESTSKHWSSVKAKTGLKHPLQSQASKEEMNSYTGTLNRWFRQERKCHVSCVYQAIGFKCTCGMRMRIVPRMQKENTAGMHWSITSRQMTMQRLLVGVTVPRCVTEVSYEMLHPCPGALWDKQRGEKQHRAQCCQSGSRKKTKDKRESERRT